MTTHVQSSQQPPSRFGCRISGVPPPPKSVRMWQVPAAGESEAEKQGLSPAGHSTSPPLSFEASWLTARGFTGVVVLVATISLLLLVIQQLTRRMPV